MLILIILSFNKKLNLKINNKPNVEKCSVFSLLERLWLDIV